MSRISTIEIFQHMSRISTIVPRGVVCEERTTTLHRILWHDVCSHDAMFVLVEGTCSARMTPCYVSAVEGEWCVRATPYYLSVESMWFVRVTPCYVSIECMWCARMTPCYVSAVEGRWCVRATPYYVSVEGM